MPLVTLSSSWLQYIGQADPSLADEIRLLVIVENGDFEILVIGRIVDDEAQLLIPDTTFSF